jgi:hypothetical protein
MIPPAAAAVIEAVLTDAQRAGVNDPGVIARWAADALAGAGWTLTPSRTPGAPQTAAQRAA